MEIIDKILEAEKCGDIFERNETKIRSLFRTYAKRIHPDVCNDPQAQKAFSKLNKLYESALNHISNHTWEETGSVQISQKIILKGVKDISSFELGARYVTDTQVAYIFDSGKDKYWYQYVTMAKLVKYGNTKMTDLYSNRMPVFNKVIDHMSADRRAIILDKTADVYPMDLFLKAYSEQLSGRDIAWMISRMCDLLCFLQYNSIVLNGFTKENLFINPERHSLFIFGGWWYSTMVGYPMLGTNKTVYSCMSPLTKTNKLSTFQTDIESMRHLASELIKDKTDIPKPILDWIDAGSSDDPIKEYSWWNKVLDAAYGKRKFVVFEADPKKIYGK